MPALEAASGPRRLAWSDCSSVTASPAELRDGVETCDFRLLASKRLRKDPRAGRSFWPCCQTSSRMAQSYSSGTPGRGRRISTATLGDGKCHTPSGVPLLIHPVAPAPAGIGTKAPNALRAPNTRSGRGNMTCTRVKERWRRRYASLTCLQQISSKQWRHALEFPRAPAREANRIHAAPKVAMSSGWASHQKPRTLNCRKWMPPSFSASQEPSLPRPDQARGAALAKAKGKKKTGQLFGSPKYPKREPWMAAMLAAAPTKV